MQEVARLAPERTRLFSQEPSHAKDWNEHLQEHQRRRSLQEREQAQEKVEQRSVGIDRWGIRLKYKKARNKRDLR